MAFLPITRKEMEERGWDAPDFVVVTGDAYVDHPSFGIAIISRVLEHYGYKVAILAQPDWRSDKDFTRFGRPRLGFMVSSGNIDSMVAHYTAARRKRSEDAYTAGNKTGKRPDRAVIVYSQKIKEMLQTQYDMSEGAQKLALLGALTLYLDFVNLFLYLLRIFGSKNN